MKKLLTCFFISLLVLSLSNCDEETGLSEAEIAQGLKEALKVGTDTAVTIVSALDGYYGDDLIKIILPPEADIIMEHKDDAILQAIGIGNLIDNVILTMNRAAEDAAVEATSIFVNAITSMTISDAIDILHGQDTAATHFLRITTFSALKNAFQPKIKTSLDKPLVLDKSTNETWSDLTTPYNTVAETLPGKAIGLEPVNSTLDEHVTVKALDGLFVKVADEERDIRNDPLARVNDILKKVFGELD